MVLRGAMVFQNTIAPFQHKCNRCSFDTEESHEQAAYVRYEPMRVVDQWCRWKFKQEIGDSDRIDRM